MRNSLLQIVENIEREVQITLGWLTVYSAVTNFLRNLSSEDPAKLYAARTKNHESALTQCKESPLNIEEFEDISHLQTEALARCLLEKAITRLFRQISKPLRYRREF